MNSATVGVAARLGIRLAIVLGLGLLWARAPLAEGTPEPRSDQTVLRDLIKGELKDADFTAGLIRTVLAKTTVENRPVVYEKLMGRNGGATDKPPEVFHRFPYEEHFRIMRASSKNNAKAFATALSAAAIALAWPAASSDLERIRQQDLKTLNAIARDFAHASAEYGILAENFRGWTVIEETQKKLKGTWTWHRWRNLIVPEMLVADFDNPRWLHEVSDKKNHAKVPATLIQDWADTNLKTWCEPIDVESGKEKWTLDGIKGATPSDRRAGALNGLRFPLDGLNHPPLLVHPAVHRWATELKNQNISSDSRDGLGKWIFEQSLGSPIACAWLQKENRANENVAKLCLFARARGHFAGASVAPEVEKVLKDAKLEGQSYEQTLARWSNAAQRGYFKRYPIEVDTNFVRSSSADEKQRAASNYGLLSYQGPAEDALQQERSEAKTLVGDVWAKLPAELATLPAELAELDRVLTTQAGQIEFVLKWLEVGPTGNPEADVLIAERLAAIGDGVFSTKDVRDELYKVMHARTEGWLAEKILKEWAKLDALEFLAERAPEGLWDLYPKVRKDSRWEANGNEPYGKPSPEIKRLEELYRTALKRGSIAQTDDWNGLATIRSAIRAGLGSEACLIQSRAAMIVANHALISLAAAPVKTVNKALISVLGGVKRFEELVKCALAASVSGNSAAPPQPLQVLSPLPLTFLTALMTLVGQDFHGLGILSENNATTTADHLASYPTWLTDILTTCSSLCRQAKRPSGTPLSTPWSNYQTHSFLLDSLTYSVIENGYRSFAWSSRRLFATMFVLLGGMRCAEIEQLQYLLTGLFDDAWRTSALKKIVDFGKPQGLPDIHLVGSTKCEDKPFPSFAEEVVFEQLIWLGSYQRSIAELEARGRIAEGAAATVTGLCHRWLAAGGLSPATSNESGQQDSASLSAHQHKWAGTQSAYRDRQIGQNLANQLPALLLSLQIGLAVSGKREMEAARKAEMEAAQAELWAAMSAHAAAELEEAALRSISEAFGSDAQAAEAMERLSHSEADIATLATDVAEIQRDIAGKGKEAAVTRLEHVQKGHESIRRVFEYRQAEYAASEALLRTLKRALIGEEGKPSIISEVTTKALQQIKTQKSLIDRAQEEARKNWWAGIVKSLVQVVCTVVGTIFGAPMLGSAIGGALGNLIGGIIKGESFDKILLNAASGGMAIAAAAGINVDAEFTKIAGKALDATGVENAIVSFKTTYDSVVNKLPDISLGGNWINEVRSSFTTGFNQANSYVGRGQKLVTTTLDELQIDVNTKLNKLGAEIENKLRLNDHALIDILKAGGITIPDVNKERDKAAKMVSQLFVANLPSEFVQARQSSEWKDFLNDKTKGGNLEWSSKLQNEVREKLKKCFNLTDGSNELDEMLVQARMCLDPNLGVKEVADALKGWSDEFQRLMGDVSSWVEKSDFKKAHEHLTIAEDWVKRANNGNDKGKDKGWSELEKAIKDAETKCTSERNAYEVASVNLQEWNIKVLNAKTDEQIATLKAEATAIEARITALQWDNAVLTTTIRGLQHRAARLRATAAESRAKAGTLAVEERGHRVTAAEYRYKAAEAWWEASKSGNEGEEKDNLMQLSALLDAIDVANSFANASHNRNVFLQHQCQYLGTRNKSKFQTRPYLYMDVTPRVYSLFGDLGNGNIGWLFEGTKKIWDE